MELGYLATGQNIVKGVIQECQMRSGLAMAVGTKSHKSEQHVQTSLSK